MIMATMHGLGVVISKRVVVLSQRQMHEKERAKRAARRSEFLNNEGV